MDPFTQRMLERARARQEKIDQKLANSGQAVPKRKPLTENTINSKSKSPIESPLKSSRESLPKKGSQEIIKPEKISPSNHKQRNDVIVTKREFKSPKRGSLTRRNSDVSVEINISHRNDIQIEVQVEERDAPISIVYNPSIDSGSNVIIKEIEDNPCNSVEENIDMADTKGEKTGLRHNVKSRLDKLANLYSDKPLSSPIHRTEQDFSLATPPPATEPAKPRANNNKKKFGKLAALADQINNWEDDLTHHTFHPETKPAAAKKIKDDKFDASTLDISIHSIKDINKVLQTTTTKYNKATKPIDAHTFIKPAVNECQRLGKKIVAELNDARIVVKSLEALGVYG